MSDEVTTVGRSRTRLPPRRLLIVGGVVAVVVVIVVVVAVVLMGGDDEGTDDAVGEITAAIVEVEDAAEDEGVLSLDVRQLRTLVENRLGDDWVTELAADADRRTVGIAAEQVSGPRCVFVWTAVGGPRSAEVTDPNLPCNGEIALIAAGG
ncbi:MAG: hypothetical protein S0880_08165 [Actinomycetota bacterium]|nr:hypothetical protein [Actinomycetota bacterium]